MSKQLSTTSNTSTNGLNRQEEKSERRSSLRRDSHNSRYEEKRRVSFDENVDVHIIESDPEESSVSIDATYDQHAKLNTDADQHEANRSPPPSELSLDNIFDEILHKEKESIEQPSTSKTVTKIHRTSSETEFDEEYAEMDLKIRMKYPKYYHFLKSHIVTGALGTETFKCQEKEFKDAIISCKNYPESYFENLENSLSLYEKMYSKNENKNDDNKNSK